MYPGEFNPELYQEKYRIKSIRLPNWNYSSDGWYFVTICTKNMVEYFGDVHNYIMGLSDVGCIAAKFWNEIPKHFPFVRLDEWVVMPNHVHGIIVIDNPNPTNQCNGRRDSINAVSTNWENGFTTDNNPMKQESLARVIQWFKGRVSFEIHKTNKNFAWQSRFHDHIIRNKKSLNEIRKYIYYNPQMWNRDRNNSSNIHK